MRGLTKKTWPIVVLMLAAACASDGEWQNADVPQEQWGEDRAACQASAQQQAEREFALAEQSNRSLNYDRGGQWARQMNRHSANQRQQDLFASCMRHRGYQLVPTGEQES